MAATCFFISLHAGCSFPIPHLLKNDYGFRRSAPELAEMEGICVAGRLVSPRHAKQTKLTASLGFTTAAGTGHLLSSQFLPWAGADFLFLHPFIKTRDFLTLLFRRSLALLPTLPLSLSLFYPAPSHPPRRSL
ncbi:hypothetical protein BJX63DRAFT_297887 [Aspergillus granulosus]|uniref:Uncharacterized protein n=1 Tax=Aspergillus granulosus TaxID=176169 RepID=A0ABR4H662_9EURO